MRKILFFCFLALGEMLLHASSPLVFLGSIPENNSEVESLNTIVLRYDLSEYKTSVSPDIGVCWYGCYYGFPTLDRTVEIYKGNEATGLPLSRYSDSWDASMPDWTPSEDITLKFPNIEVEPGADYTVKVTLEVYAQTAQNTSEYYGDIFYNEEPLILHYKGACMVNKSLIIDTTDFDNNKISEIGVLPLKFNYPISIVKNEVIGIYEDGTKLYESIDVKVSEDDNSILEVYFGDDVQLYNSHSYILEVPSGIVSIIDDTSLLNKCLEIGLQGGGYHMFGVKSSTPRNGQTSLLDQVKITYAFPEGSGFKYSGSNVYPLKIYKGEPLEESFITSVNGVVVSSDQELVYDLDTDWEAGTTYTFVQEEGVIPSKSDYKSERIELHFSTPEVEDLPKVELAESTNLTRQLETLEKGLAIAFAPYEYKYEDYSLTREIATPMTLVEVDGERETELGNYWFYFDSQANTLTLDSHMNADGEFGIPLYEGKTYKFTFPQGTIAPNHRFLKRYAGNEAFELVIEGTTSTECNVTVTGADGHSFTTVWPRNSKVTIDLAAAPGWEVKEVGHDADDDATVEGNRLTIDSLTKDVNVNVAHELTEPVEFYDISTDVQEIKGTDYKIAREGMAVVITGLNVGDVVTVYTMSGYPMASHKANLDTLKFNLDPGIYVISINDVIFKIQI